MLAAAPTLALIVSALTGAEPIPEATPDPEPAHLYGLHIYLAGEAARADDDAFLKVQLERARRLFAGIDVDLEVIAVDELPRDGKDAEDGTIETRAERDALGHSRWKRGEIAVFIVNRLYDVDEPRDEEGNLRPIRGVHWRDRAVKDHRWVILWRGSPPHVLAHELGHFFSLPHGIDPASIMNKAPRTDPPPEDRGFVAAEQKRMRSAERRMRTSGYLRDRREERK